MASSVPAVLARPTTYPNEDHAARTSTPGTKWDNVGGVPCHTSDYIKPSVIGFVYSDPCGGSAISMRGLSPKAGSWDDDYVARAPEPDPDPEAKILRKMETAREESQAEEEPVRPRLDRTARRRRRERALEVFEVARARMPVWRWFLTAPFDWVLMRTLTRAIRKG